MIAGMSNATIATVANRTSVLAAIGGVLPEIAAGGPQAVRIVSLHGPAAIPTAIAVDEATAADRNHGKPGERWVLVVVDADAEPSAIYTKRSARTVVLACSRDPIPGHPAVACN